MLTIIGYREKEYRLDLTVGEIPGYLQDKKATLWVDLEAPTSEEMQILSNIFQFHPLTIEDCETDNHFPKIDNYQDYIFLVVHGVNFHTPINEFTTVELDVYSGENYLVTCHKHPVRTVNLLKEKAQRSSEIFQGKGNILLYNLLVMLVNNYLPALKEFDENLIAIEEDLFQTRDQDLLESILLWRNNVSKLRRIIGPQKDVLDILSRNDMAVIQSRNRIYLRDIYDHFYRVYEMTKSYRDMIAGNLEVYLILSSNEQAEVSHRLNKVMKTLTAVIAVLMPPILIAGIYGMNLKYLPGLHSISGHILAFLLMVAASGSMILFLKKKKWL